MLKERRKQMGRKNALTAMVLTVGVCFSGGVIGSPVWAQTPTLGAAVVESAATVSLSKARVELGANVNQVEVDILLNVSKGAPIASADLSFKLSDNVTRLSFKNLMEDRGANTLGPKAKDGLEHFGFFSTKNQYEGTIKVATVTLSYTGSQPGWIKLDEASATIIENQYSVIKKPMTSVGEMAITRAGSVVGPGGNTNPTPGGNTNPTTPPGGNTQAINNGNANTNTNTNANPNPSGDVTLNINDAPIALGTLAVLFEDIDNTWAKDYIRVLASFGIVQGKTSTLFAPEEKIIRGDFVKLLVGVLGKKETSLVQFKDVLPTDYYYEAIQTATKLGLVSGFKGYFKPATTITREDMAVMLYRAYKVAKVALPKPAALTAYGDQNQVSGYAREAIGTLVAMGALEGHNQMLNPKSALTRAETTKVLFALREAMLKK